MENTLYEIMSLNMKGKERGGDYDRHDCQQ